MKMKKITFLLLSLFSAASFAGNYADTGADAVPQNNKESESHFYIDLGANDYYFNQPSMNLPISTGDYVSSGPYPNASGTDYNADNWAFNPNITLGYQFLTDNESLQKIFGQQNALELHASYFHNTGTQDENYDQPYYVNEWLITGGAAPFLPASEIMADSSVDFDNTYIDIGLYYTGNKIISNTLINSPYIGVDVSYLKQNSDYTADSYAANDTDHESVMVMDGSDDLSSYYMGLVFGDKATWLFAKNYGVYGKAGAGVYLMHTKLSASQTPVSNIEMATESLNATYTVEATDDQPTFKLNAEVGINYYFKNNQDQTSPRITLLAGLDYWNDVAYAENPTEGEQVKIAYDSTVNPYLGLQMHIPL